VTFANKFLGKTQDQIKPILESEVENPVVSYARKKGYVVDKFTSPSKRSVPDDLFLSPCGVIFFAEFKAPGKKPTKKQAEDHARRRANNALVYVIDDVDEGKRVVDFFLEMGV